MSLNKVRRIANYVPATPPSPYAHLIGPDNYAPAGGLFGWMERMGARLNIAEVVLVRGHWSYGYLRGLLAPHGVLVRGIHPQADPSAAWWQMWRWATCIRVARYHGVAAKAILRDNKLEVIE